MQTLYNQLIYSPTTSVTPITELAYLALVPSKEETDLIAKSQSQSQANGEASTSKTSAPSSEETKSPTVLGKRTIEHLDEGLGLTLEPMMLDSSGKSPLGNRDVNTIDEDVTMISTDVSTSPSATSPREGENGRQTRRKATPSGSLLSPVDLRSATMEAKEGMDGVVEIGHPSDVEMSLRVDVSSNPVPPPLPPRNGKGKESNLELEVSNYMAFGESSHICSRNETEFNDMDRETERRDRVHGQRHVPNRVRPRSFIRRARIGNFARQKVRFSFRFVFHSLIVLHADYSTE